MPTVIDSLIVTLGLNAASFTQGATQAQAALKNTTSAANATAKGVQTQAQAVAAFLTKTAAAITGTANTAATAQTKAQAAVTKVAQTSAAAQAAAQNLVVVLINNTQTKAHQAANSMNASGKLAAEFFGKIRNAAFGLAAVFMGGKGLQSFIADTVTSMAQLGRQANAIGMDVGRLAGVGGAVARFGGNAAAAAQNFVSLADAMQRAISMGDTTAIGAFQAMGVQLGDKPEQILLKLAKYAETNSVGQTRLVGQHAGIDDGLITLALKGQAQVRKEIEEAAKRSGITPQMVANMSALQSAWAKFSQTAEGVGNRLLGLFAPAMTLVLEKMTATVEWIARLVDAYPNWTRVVVLLVGALIALKTAMAAIAVIRLFAGGAGVLSGIAGVLGGLSTGLGTFAVALTRLLAPLSALALWWEALHIRGASGAEERAFEQAHNEAYAREHPEAVVPQVTRPNAAGDWWRRNAPTFLGGGGSSPGGAANPSGAVNQADPAELMTYFREQGWSEEQAAGIIANFKGESNLNAAAIGDNGASAGLGQWRGARRAAYKAMFGHDVQYGSPLEQAKFAQWELTHTEIAAGRALFATTNRADAAREVSRRFERPGTTEAERTMNAEHRAALAQDPNLLRSAARTGAIDPALAARARPLTPPQRLAQNDNSSETHIGHITITTQATDARGIARSLDPAIRSRTAMVAQSNSGLA